MFIDTLGTNYTQEAASGISDKELGKEDFLMLLVTQMQNQDPLNPMEATEFTAQLAQFSSLEQLYNIDETLGLIKSGQSQNSNYQALDFIGKEISAQGAVLSFKNKETATGSFTIQETADCNVMITDSNGNYIRKISLSSMLPGTHKFDWDGYDDAGKMQADGIYGFEVIAMGKNGQILPVESKITGKVDSVNLEGNSPVLYVGEIPVSIFQVMEISIKND